MKSILGQSRFDRAHASFVVLAVALGCGSDPKATAENKPVPTVVAPPPAAPPADAGVDAAPPDAPDAPVLSCPASSTMLFDRTSCPPTAPPAPASLAAALSAAAGGDVVALDGISTPTIACAPAVVCQKADAPRLFFSDSPESVEVDGILYADTLAVGRTRIYVYHANKGVAPRKFSVVVLNPGTETAKLDITRAGVAPPSKDYLATGRAALDALARAQAPRTVVIAAGQRVLLDGALDAVHAANAELVHAIYEVQASAPLKVSVVSVAASADAAALAASLPLLPREAAHQRGTFPTAELIVAARVVDGEMRRLRLGADQVDAPLAGRDATTGEAITLLGNFGVTYRLLIDAPAGARLAVTPRGGAWAGAVGDGGAATLLPRAATALADTTRAIALGGARDLHLTTAGSSSLPLDVLVVP